MEEQRLLHILESILFLSGGAVKISDISEKLNVKNKDVLKAARALQNTYANECGINILIFNDNLQFSSNPKYAEEVAGVLNPIKEHSLSKTMLEVISIIAYKQPITRLEIEHLRGVNSDYAISVLSDNNLIEIVGRKDTIGKPVLFGTTDKFLRQFQIEKLEDLPDYDDLLEKIKITESRTRDIYDKEIVNVNIENIDAPKEHKAATGEMEGLPEHLRGEEDIIVIG